MNKTENPIKNNRIIEDSTFALRLLNFALYVRISDAYSEDEKKSMIHYATKLLNYQIKTVTDKIEKGYLDRCNAYEKLKEGLEFIDKV